MLWPVGGGTPKSLVDCGKPTPICGTRRVSTCWTPSLPLPFPGGGLLGLVAAESRFWLGPAGFPLMTAVHALKGFHWLRTRRHPTT